MLAVPQIDREGEIEMKTHKIRLVFLLVIVLLANIIFWPNSAFANASALYVKDIVAYYNSSFALKSDGTLWAAGSNEYGQLGDGTKINKTSWTKVLSDVAQVSVGGYHTFVLKTDGTLWAVGGSSWFGELGDGVTKNTTEWTQVMSDVSQVSAGFAHSLVLKKDGSIWAAGFNGKGQPGDGTTKNRATWIQVLTGVSQICAGYYSSFAIKTDGTLWAAGLGNLGDGKEENHTVWTQVLDHVLKVSASCDFNLALKTDGTLWAAGVNADGNFGIGTTEDSDSWTKVLADVADVSAGGNFSLALKTNGTLLATGFNNKGQLGFGSNAGITSWTLVLTDVSKISAGGMHSFAITKNGRVMTAGFNEEGQLGIGSTINVNLWIETFVIVPPDSTVTATPTTSTVLVNGVQKVFDAYLINENNYFKLRDLAYVMSSTEKQFYVFWDDTRKEIRLTPGLPYKTVGGEMTAGDGMAKMAKLNVSSVYKDSAAVTLTAYTIDGYNYVKLRDIAKAFNFGVKWDDASNTISIDTKTGYAAD